MSERPVCSTRTVFGATNVYFHDDRVEVGVMSPVYTEDLRRVAYRDVRRLVIWNDQRTLSYWFGILLFVATAVLALILVGEGVWEVALVAGGAGAVFGAVFVWMGRPRGITRFRVEGVRGKVVGVMGGRAAKRRRLMEELEQRIRARQSVSAGAAIEP